MTEHETEWPASARPGTMQPHPLIFILAPLGGITHFHFSISVDTH